jgi:hypothetical protein
MRIEQMDILFVTLFVCGGTLSSGLGLYYGLELLPNLIFGLGLWFSFWLLSFGSIVTKSVEDSANESYAHPNDPTRGLSTREEQLKTVATTFATIAGWNVFLHIIIALFVTLKEYLL